jgi:hypothetical protein
MVNTALTFLTYVHQRAIEEPDDDEWDRAIWFLADLHTAMDDALWPLAGQTSYSEEKVEAYWLGFKAGRQQANS